MEHTHINKEDQINRENPTVSHGDKAPDDPSNTSHIGQKVEQGVISKKEGIADQSSEWEDLPERGTTGESLINKDADRYIKDPSPEENGEEKI